MEMRVQKFIKRRYTLSDINVYYPDTIEDQDISSDAIEVTVSSGSTATSEAAGTDNTIEVASSIRERPTPIPVVAGDLVSNSLNSQMQQILGTYTFGKVGAMQIGEYEDGVSGDVRITPDGITARNSAGTTTFSLDGTTGDATFLGTIAAGSVISTTIAANKITGTIVNAQIAEIDWAKITDVEIENADITSLSADKITSGTLSGINLSIGSSNSIFKADTNGVYLGNATFSSAPFSVSMSGALKATSATITGNIETSSSGKRVKMDATNNQFSIKNDSEWVGGIYGSDVLYMYSENGYDIFLDSDDDISISSDDLISISAGGNLALAGSAVYVLDHLFIDDVTDHFYDIMMNDNDIREVGDLVFNDSSQYINASSTVLKYHADSDHTFYKDGSAKAVIDSNFWTDGDIYADGTKYFLIAHPDGSDRSLKYAAQESPDVVLRYRGKGTIQKNGLCEIAFPTHFTLVTEDKGLTTANLTPVGNNKVWVNTVDNKSLVVGGDKGTEFFYEVMAIRSGYLNSPVEIDNTDDGIKNYKKALEGVKVYKKKKDPVVKVSDVASRTKQLKQVGAGEKKERLKQEKAN